jgi:hypothetical protein
MKKRTQKKKKHLGGVFDFPTSSSNPLKPPFVTSSRNTLEGQAPSGETVVWPVKPDFNPDLTEIYENYYIIQRSEKPLTLTLSSKLKTSIKDKFPKYTEDELKTAVTQVTRQLTTSIKEAEDSEAKEMTLDPEIAAQVQNYYNDLKTKNPVPQGASAEDINEFKQNLKSKALKYLVDKHPDVNHPGLRRRYISELKDEKEIDLKTSKFEELYSIISCNPECLKKEIDKLAMGMEAKAKLDIIDLTEEISKLKDAESKVTSEAKLLEINESLVYYEKLLEKQKDTTFTPKEIKTFEAAYNSGSIAKIFPHIQSQCGKKTISNTSRLESSSTSVSEPTSSDSCVGLMARDKEKDQKLSYSDVSELLKCLIYNIKKEGNAEKIAQLTERKNSLLAILPTKFQEETKQKLKQLIEILNKKPETTPEFIEQRGVQKAFIEVQNNLSNFNLDDIVDKLNKDSEKQILQEKKLEDERNKLKQIEEMKKQKIEEKKTFIEDFIKRNPSSGDEYIKSLSGPARNRNLTDFSSKFPLEDRDEFWIKVVGTPFGKWTPPKSTASSTTKKPTPPKSFDIKLSSQPTEDEIELNKRFFNFEVNAEGKFIKDGKVVNFLGDEPTSVGGYRKSKRRNRASMNKSKNKRKIRRS